MKRLLIIAYILSSGCRIGTISVTDGPGEYFGYTSSECVILELDCLNVDGLFTFSNHFQTGYICKCEWVQKKSND